MERSELKEIVCRVIDAMRQTPSAACIWTDDPCDQCDVTTYYAVGEEN